MERMNAIFRNKKTGKLYVCLGYGTDCTNSRDGLIVVIYRALDGDTKTFVREKQEFEGKFEMTKPDASAGAVFAFGRRRWTWGCWAIWVFTGYMAIATLGSGGFGNPYAAAMLVMAFLHYTRPKIGEKE